jgi:hypothetical protein
MIHLQGKLFKNIRKSKILDEENNNLTTTLEAVFKTTAIIISITRPTIE